MTRMAIGALAALAVSAGAAQAQERATYGNFEFDRYSDVCTIEGDFPFPPHSDRNLMVILLDTGPRIVVSSADWDAIENRESYFIDFVFDRGARTISTIAEGIVFSHGTKGVQTAASDAMLTALSQSAFLEVRFSGRLMAEIDLTGSSNAVAAFRACTTDVRTNRAADPFAD